MKTERIEFVAPPGLKARLQEEASRNNISVGELIRQRFEPTGDEMELAKLTEELKKATTVACSDFARAIGEVSALVDELRSRRSEVERQAT
ncbi:MAG: hypothetical protein U0932_07940 [Thiobacillus sp.]|nr:hypothetical protein [Thiobacillus sp.]